MTGKVYINGILATQDDAPALLAHIAKFPYSTQTNARGDLNIIADRNFVVTSIGLAMAKGIAWAERLEVVA